MRARRATALAIALAVLHAAAPALAQSCAAPVPPDVRERPAKLAPPERSPCVDAKPGTAGCMGWEQYSYNDAIKAYNAKVPAFKTAADAYVAKLNAFVQASSDYARCEIKAMQ